MSVMFPETPIADDDAWLREQERRRIKAMHWRRGWLSAFQYEGGIPVRLGFWECRPNCPCHDDDWWNRP